MSKGNVISSAFIKLGVDSDKIKADLEGIRKRVDAFAEHRLKTMNLNAFIGTLQSIGKDILVDFVSDTKAIGRMSNLLHMSVEEMDILLKTAEDFGVEIQDAGNNFIDIRKNALEFVQNGTGPLAELKGINGFDTSQLTDAEGNLKNIKDIVYIISDALADLDERNSSAFAGRIGINAPKMIAYIKRGSKAIDDQAKQLREHGVRTQRDIDTINEFSRAVKESKRAIGDLLLPVFRLMSPAIRFLSSAVRELIDHWQLFIPMLVGLTWLLSRDFLPIVETLVKTIVSGLKAIGMAFGISFGWLTLIIGVLAVLGLILEDFLVWLDGGESEWGEFWEACFGSAEEVKSFFEGSFFPVLKQCWEGLTELANGFLNVLLKMMHPIDTITSWWKETKGRRIAMQLEEEGLDAERAASLAANVTNNNQKATTNNITVDNKVTVNEAKDGKAYAEKTIESLGDRDSYDDFGMSADGAY